ncbi:aminotransferase class I/II-fold pyridoxal phosphate-dependent enzyme [Fulvivirgaceae bacterium BMA10]|uniref:Aminotransferase class I/II-fold pyridoxal phosphate-dependent enzyme n=1 Tax=Splendidivirga corallicola TaxID=3051826 RepID=A0ABT8KY76_9BACT|nr:aminotransferase class I/II-fold pyridoxal phosphate-dependent enzyme [Fulvivirgaceae bacterium BMA10]
MPFTTDANIITQALDKFRSDSNTAKSPVLNQVAIDEIIQSLDLASYIQHGGLTDGKLAEFMNNYLTYALRLHHPAYLGHQCAATHEAGSLGAFVDAFTNNVMAVYEMGPGAASIEYFMVNWLLEKVGWLPAPVKQSERYEKRSFGGGVLVNGGSIANLTALIIARSKLVPEVWEEGSPSNLSILAPSESHYSIQKAAGFMGIGKNAIYTIDVDQNGAIIPKALQAALDRSKNDGKRPIALIANACSTAVGIYDPLDEIGAFCQENNIWLHVDGAHGASALLSSKHKHLLKGVEKADSLTWDAHKLLRTPSLCAALLVRDHSDLDSGIHQEASYLFHDKEPIGFDFIQRTIECTKSGLGVKLFFTIAAEGEEKIAAYIDGRYALAKEVYHFVIEQSDLECPVAPESNILCFRVQGSDEKQMRIWDKLMTEGSFHLSTTMFMGKRFLRLVFMSPHTTITDIQRLINRIREINKEIGNAVESPGLS